MDWLARRFDETRGCRPSSSTESQATRQNRIMLSPEAERFHSVGKRNRCSLLWEGFQKIVVFAISPRTPWNFFPFNVQCAMCINLAMFHASVSMFYVHLLFNGPISDVHQIWLCIAEKSGREGEKLCGGFEALRDESCTTLSLSLSMSLSLSLTLAHFPLALFEHFRFTVYYIFYIFYLFFIFTFFTFFATFVF